MAVVCRRCAAVAMTRCVRCVPRNASRLTKCTAILSRETFSRNWSTDLVMTRWVGSCVEWRGGRAFRV